MITEKEPMSAAEAAASNAAYKALYDLWNEMEKHDRPLEQRLPSLTRVFAVMLASTVKQGRIPTAAPMLIGMLLEVMGNTLQEIHALQSAEGESLEDVEPQGNA